MSFGFGDDPIDASMIAFGLRGKVDGFAEKLALALGNLLVNQGGVALSSQFLSGFGEVEREAKISRHRQPQQENEDARGEDGIARDPKQRLPKRGGDVSKRDAHRNFTALRPNCFTPRST